jgi:hypothetical protein
LSLDSQATLVFISRTNKAIARSRFLL